MPVRHSRSAVRSTRRRALVWCTFTATHNGVATGTNITDDMLADFHASGASTLGATIMRTHISGSYAPFSTGGHLAYGLIIGRKTVDAAADTPVISTGPELDWMQYSELFPGASGATVNATNAWSLDLKAKRKMQELDQTLLFVAAPSDTGNSSYTLFARILLALP